MEKIQNANGTYIYDDDGNMISSTDVSITEDIINGYVKRQKRIIEARKRLYRMEGKSEEQIHQFEEAKLAEMNQYVDSLRNMHPRTVDEDCSKDHEETSKALSEIHEMLEDLLN